jgi:translocation and assembly module TamA
MRERVSGQVDARLLCAVAITAALARPAYAQQPQQPQQSVPPADVDPLEPLAPLPDLGVDWPKIGDEAPPQQAGQPAAPASPVVATTSAERRYSIAIEGLDQVGDAKTIVDTFERQSALYEERKDEANAAQIQRRSEADSELLTQIMLSNGYYDAMVEPDVRQSGSEVVVTLSVQPGQQYVFQSIELPGLDEAGPEAEKLRDAFAIKPGDAVVASDVLAADIALKVALGEQGFALADVGEREITVNHETHLATLVQPVDPGPVAHFGRIRVTGAKAPFDAEHVQSIARFKPGDRFERDRVDDLRRALIATGLLSSADVKLVPEANGQAVDVVIDMQPAPPRTIAGELGYGTGEGLSIQASWTHRNFFPPEGAVTVRGIAGTREQLGGVQFRRNNFRGRDQVLDVQLVASHVKYDAYSARTINFAADLERQSNIIWRKKWTWGVGAELLLTDELGVFNDITKKETRTFFIAAVPAHLAYDGSNDLLDPTTGFRLSLRASPEYSGHGGSFEYARLQFDGSAYYPVTSSAVLAGRVRFGTIAGARASQIAPSRRFYSGGGGSVRGYGYQRLGPRDVNGDPIGGRGLAEFALEARVRFGNFGIVPFFDGGSLNNAIAPNLGKWQFGAGVGLRYYSSLGPIRIDVGTPINRRSGDSRIAVAVSLGQAF